MVYHVDSHVASCSMENHMVNHEVGLRCMKITCVARKYVSCVVVPRVEIATKR